MNELDMFITKLLEFLPKSGTVTPAALAKAVQDSQVEVVAYRERRRLEVIQQLKVLWPVTPG